MEWEAQRLCTEAGDYELFVEKQKLDWECDQPIDQWKWAVVIHGTIVASGTAKDLEGAQRIAEASIPQEA
ncbi:hypothetical protein J0X12_17100 [Sneathiella sp. CAU 1612]|jgi:hypothetical protein|uniref:BON domain-containing protein n=1 Tax=Sneathiella sedimenti TaxID=2816034 RepID=A0ABS3FAH9_9PROT|nr:hypothetical protein [Sneathiella sedimenti]MBO0335342.1 hypothetical protein [Sneathiella sedimenti]